MKTLYTITVKAATHTVLANSPAHACRLAFKHLIKNKEIPRQPKSTTDGGFEDTTVEILF